jgi:two-component system chemotaxis response regulator CheB
MPKHNIIVVGASAGGVKTLLRLTASLPPDINAAIFIAQHLAPDRRSVLPELLNSHGKLRAALAVDEEKVEHGRIYLAPPDYHLLIEEGFVRVMRGPKENGFRPSIDALFRSAARAYGPRAVGVILSGSLNDGTVGLRAIKTCGGKAIVQDPNEAAYRSMPLHAIRHVAVDWCLALAEIAPLLVRLTTEQVAEEGAHVVPDHIEIESRIAKQDLNTKEFLEAVEKIGTRTTYTCPECHGNLWQIPDDELLRFRCHVGHAYLVEALLSSQSRKLEDVLWSAVRALEEKVSLTRQFAARLSTQQRSELGVQLDEAARRIDEHVALVREIILTEGSTPLGPLLVAEEDRAAEQDFTAEKAP